jgi:hypothetical protein
MVNKTIYLMTGGITKHDNKYKITDPKIKEIIKKALQRKYQIGIHPSFEAGRDKALFEDEVNKLSKILNTKIIHSRQHFLRMDWNLTPYIWSKLGIEIDSSMGYKRHIGFRCGTGFTYNMYDFNNEKPFPWFEEPLVFMESALIHYCKNNILSLNTITKEFFHNHRNNTHITINFHNSNFDPLVKTGNVLKNIYVNEIFKYIEQ